MLFRHASQIYIYSTHRARVGFSYLSIVSIHCLLAFYRLPLVCSTRGLDESRSARPRAFYNHCYGAWHFFVRGKNLVVKGMIPRIRRMDGLARE